MEEIILDRKQALALLCLCQQAERSIDHALPPESPQWPQMLRYYSDRREAVGQYWRELLGAIDAVETCPVKSGEGIGQIRQNLRSQPKLGGCRFSGRGLLWDGRTGRLSVREAVFVADCLRRLISMLHGATPTLEEAIELRMDFAPCRAILAERVNGVKPGDRAFRIENFGMPLHMEHFTLDEIKAASDF